MAKKKKGFADMILDLETGDVILNYPLGPI